MKGQTVFSLWGANRAIKCPGMVINLHSIFCKNNWLQIETLIRRPHTIVHTPPCLMACFMLDAHTNTVWIRDYLSDISIILFLWPISIFHLIFFLSQKRWASQSASFHLHPSNHESCSALLTPALKPSASSGSPLTEPTMEATPSAESSSSLNPLFRLLLWLRCPIKTTRMLQHVKTLETSWH